MDLLDDASKEEFAAALERALRLFLNAAGPAEIVRALQREEVLFRVKEQLGRRSFLSLIDSLQPSLGSERLYEYLREIEEARARRRAARGGM